VGFLSTAILVVNNIRDIDTDRRAGKRTLAVRLGRERTRKLYFALVLGAFGLLPISLLVTGGPAEGLFALFAIYLASRPARAVAQRTDGPSLNAALAGTGMVLAAFSVLLSAGLLIAA
jgi:1,4-dihydroxy-2-naphthoate octaprenyltransferase